MGVPGGKLEANETPEASIIRELQEELCIDVTVNKILQPYTIKYLRTLKLSSSPFIVSGKCNR